MMTIVDVTKIIEQNRLMKRLVLQTEDANRAKTNLFRICHMRYVRR